MERTVELEDWNGSISFGDCVLHLGTRELIRGGIAQTAEPRAWDLLVYLIRHRERVVPKEELLETIWSASEVSDAVLPQAVMKARALIGDDAGPARLIQTMHRVGYRFVGDVRGATPVREALPAAPDVLPPVVVVLPVINRVDDPALAWAQLGLLTLMCREIEATRQVRIAPLPQVLAALGSETDPAADAQRSARLRERLGARASLETTLSSDPAGYALEATVTVEGAAHVFRATHHSPTTLALEAARRAATLISPDPAVDVRYAFDTQDHFLNEAFARAMRAKLEMRFEECRNLLALCADEARCPLGVRCEHLVFSAFALDASTPAVAQRVLEIAAATHSPHAQAAALMALAYYNTYDGKAAEAETLADRALALLGGGGSPEDRIQALFARANLAVMAYEFAYAKRLAEELATIETREPSMPRIGLAQRYRGEIFEMMGDGIQARQVYEARLSAYPKGVPRTDAGLAYVLYGSLVSGMGDFAAARVAFAAAEAHARESAGAVRINFSLAWITHHLREGDLMRAREARAALAAESRAQTQAWRGALRQADTLIAYAQGAAEAVEIGAVAAADLSVLPYFFWRDAAWVTLAEVALVHHRPEVAQRARAGLVEHPAFDHTPNKRGAAALIEALIAYSEGAPDRARSALAPALALQLSSDVGRALVFADAWLLLDEGHVDRPLPAELLGDLLHVHPAGCLIGARAALARGEPERATRILEELAERLPGNSPWVQSGRRALAAVIAQGARGLAASGPMLLPL